MYWPPYGDRPWFAERAALLNGRYLSNKTLIVGCGWGYTVQYCLNLGMDAWGCDASQYALDKATEVLPAATRARIMLGDATSAASLEAVRSFAGLKGKTKFTGAMTEDMLSMLTPAEVQLALPAIRGVAGNVAHLITCSKPNDLPGMRLPGFGISWRTIEEWKAIVAPDTVIDVETGEQL